MGNSYIDTNIRPLISALARRHKVVVLATHNANIAVRTLPYAALSVSNALTAITFSY